MEKQTKLHDNQLRLIQHVILFNVLDYESCLHFLDTDETRDHTALSYQFRPLIRNKYLSKDKDGIVRPLKKCRSLFPDLKPLISTGSKGSALERVLQVSRMGALMAKNGIPITDTVPDSEEPNFIPSACWRKIATGILSTTRFTGILLAYGRKYAVYDIGDGDMDWQVRAESSLFFRKYGAYETRADGMIFICRDDMREMVARKIIRQTMWSRKTLMKEQYSETDKPVKYSFAPIKLRIQYEHVYLTTPALLSQSLERIYGEEELIEYYADQWEKTHSPKLGDVEDYPDRYFLNPAFDLLKLVYFFSVAKDQLEKEKASFVSGYQVNYIMVMHKEDMWVLNMYPNYLEAEGVMTREFKSNENS